MRSYSQILSVPMMFYCYLEISYILQYFWINRKFNIPKPRTISSSDLDIITLSYLIN